MATINAVFLYGIPEDRDTNAVRILESTSENGTYTIVEVQNYVYGQKASEYDAADSERWYKIQFLNSVAGETSPESDIVFGGDYDKSKPFFAISTSFDGAGYASVTELLSQSKLSLQDVTSANCARALKISRAFIDLVSESQSVGKFSKYFDLDTSRRKYNAYLEILKQCEINFALSILYKNLADDWVMKSVRDNTGVTNFDSVSIGQTSLSQSDPTNLKVAEFLDTQSQRYGSQAASLLQTLVPTSIPISYSEVQKRVSPIEWTAFAGSYISHSADQLDLVTVLLTGHGVAMNGAAYTFTGASPVILTSTLNDAILTVNGVNYPIESYVGLTGTSVPIGSVNTGFVLSLYSGQTIRWNFTTANGGFDLTNTDIIQLQYWA